jgi:protein-S-isoprenylcysteine O-methyltransferase
MAWRWRPSGSVMTPPRSKMAPRSVRSGDPSVTWSLCPIRRERQYHRSVRAVFWVSMAAWFALEASLVLREGRSVTRGAVDDRGSGPFVLVLIASAVVIDLALSRSGNQPGLRTGALFGAGIGCVWSGLALRVWAVLTLGRFFRLVVLVQSGHRVIRHGPYRVLRHPSYTGTLLTLVGLGLMLDSWIGLAGCVVLPLIGYARRIAVEEAALRERLGSEYVEYSSSTRRLVPFIW